MNDDLPGTRRYRVDLPSLRAGYGNIHPSTVGEGDRAAGADGVGENLDPSWLHGDPPWLELFEVWLREALDARIAEPNAMVLGTVDAAGLPVTRTVLCKGADADGITFFTNYDSDKGRDLAVHPYASVTFPWIALERQVHVRGPVVKVSAAETAEYWTKRPRGSQLSAAASDQSQPIGSRLELEAKAAEVAHRFGGFDSGPAVPVPDNWGGYRITPQVVEFWQGRANRLHNRVRLILGEDGWHARRLQP
ncbi:pyridoxamine 5'-phosphate oxidase [Gordonia pseudamarae]|uniref:Pyridoxine/pyridoxamine 5'-phosphate oxidase n=1 Tax=Gordonia pseudamarae TaxID=2831662 RepID=A0ABX6IEX1_9ACTN|nr:MULTISPECIES: pyridoxamine 5'-phosphate oxidase [Gordonia]MBD0023645.1 pyridoxamine 5'-phosphate oxidase [Gordonia sp. (in: high G+C Gram-positive bacteria)]QHN25457.1 pyridoxamine 5'-phosphate oxidase [Gordonia pseudamarae]QHN34389.1 pyridoxamine 5'-phosphate oxidase [Gordonia pseudamarae]